MIAIGVVVLMVVTGNVILAILGMFTVMLIMVNIISVIVYLGWELGPTECVALVASVGSSMIPIVQLASRYTTSQFPGRENRIKDSVQEHGI